MMNLNSFVWDFYVVYAISFGLFGGVRLLLAVSGMALRKRHHARINFNTEYH